MADQFESLEKILKRAKSDCMKEAVTGSDIGNVSSFFSELEAATSALTQKYSQKSRFGKVQMLIPSQDMVVRYLRKIHTKIRRRLQARIKLANPWRAELSVDMPIEVFDCISKHILNRTNFGHSCKESRTQTVYEIFDLEKAKYLFRRMDLDGSEVEEQELLRKNMNSVDGGTVERCEVLVSKEQLFEFKFNKTNEVLTVKFHYGYWNRSGIPQH